MVFSTSSHRRIDVKNCKYKIRLYAGVVYGNTHQRANHRNLFSLKIFSFLFLFFLFVFSFCFFFFLFSFVR